MKDDMTTRPIGPIKSGTAGLFCLALVALSGCAVPDRPARPAVYDFGPGALAMPPALSPNVLPALTLAEVEATAALDSTAVLYRLAYADAQQLRPYAQARWSMAPAQLLRQRLRERLSLDRAVLNPGESAAPGAAGPSEAKTLRIELEEFSQLFEAPGQSVGLLRLRATVLQATPLGDRLVAQRTVLVRRPAASADAPGGVRALTVATDAAVLELEQWLRQLR